jgi:hypothetical protein
LQKIKRNGGDLKYLIMDEPFYFGHRYSGPTACHEPAEALAKRIAETTVVARRIFPHLEVGTVEVVDQSGPWVDELLAWTDTYKRVTGESLAFLNTDVSWSEPSMRNLAPLEKGLRERHIPFGVIYNADAETRSDAMFLDSARRHIGEVGPGPFSDWQRCTEDHKSDQDESFAMPWWPPIAPTPRHTKLIHRPIWPSWKRSIATFARRSR